MPPAAISRSSTYFPKICGNITSGYRSAFGALLLHLPLLLASCSPLEPEQRTLEIHAFSLEPPEHPCAVPPNAEIDIRALGPFPVSPVGAERIEFSASNHALAFPDDTHGVEAFATNGDRTWLGYSDRLTSKGLDVLLLEAGVGCELVDTLGPQYPGPGAGQAVGYSPEAGLVLVAGGDSSSGFAGTALVFETGTGKNVVVAESLSFPGARAFASATPFGGGFLLAGGENPLVESIPAPQRETLETAAVYDSEAGGFSSETIALEQPRTRHAAVVLPNGDTLLIGGRRSTGTSTPDLVTLLEGVSPATRHAYITHVALLSPGRIEPSAVVLSDGRILVGGGYDSSGAPVDTLQWLSPDGSCVVAPATGECINPEDPGSPVTHVEARHHRAFAALPGGGALTVGGCAPEAVQTSECQRECGPNFGCPAADPDAWWISPDGVLTFVPLPPTRDCGRLSPEHALLAPGSDGAVWLLAFDEVVSPPCRAVYRFDPWREAFVAAELDPVRWPDPRVPLTSLGPDAFVWLSEGNPPYLTGLRAGSRGALSQNETSLLVPNPDSPQSPSHLAPDRPLGTSNLATFLPNGVLRLEAADIPATVVVTDTLYDDVVVTLALEERDPPVVLFGSYAVGDASCAWPDNVASPLTVTRTGDAVTLADSSHAPVHCRGAPKGPLSIGIRAGGEGTTLTSFVVERL